MHSIVVVKCKHSSFSGRSPTGGMKRNISFFSLEKREHHILEWTLTKLANTLKNASKEKFLWSFIDFFCLLHIQFSRKLNWKQWSFTKLSCYKCDFYKFVVIVKDVFLNGFLITENTKKWLFRKKSRTFPGLLSNFPIFQDSFQVKFH